MKRIQILALGVLIGVFCVMAVGRFAPARGAADATDMLQARQDLAKEKALLDQMNMQYQTMQHDMSMTNQMQMTPTEKAMMKQMNQMSQMIKMLVQSNMYLTDVLQMMTKGQPQ